MTIKELIEKWGGNYIIESRITDSDYKYTTEFLEKLSAEENEFIEDLKVVLNERYLGNAIIYTGNNRKKVLSFIGSYNFNWDSVFELVNNKVKSEPRSEVNTINNRLVDAGKELRGSLKWRLPVKKINVGSFKEEFVEELLVPGSDLRVKSEVIPIDPNSDEFKKPESFYKREVWITSGRRSAAYQVELSRRVNRSTVDNGSIITTSTVEYYQVGRSEIINQYKFDLNKLENVFNTTINKLKVNVTGTELVIGDTLEENLMEGIQVPIKKEDLDLIIEDIKSKSAPYIGDIIKKSIVQKEQNNYKFITIPYKGAKYYDKNFNILEIIKPSKFVELPTSINSTTALN